MHLHHEVLTRYRTIAVVGLSPKPERPSHQVAHYMQRNGYRIVPVNPVAAGKKILGETCYGSLAEAAAALAQSGLDIELVDCFRKSEEIGAIADEAIAIAANCLWLQLGVTNPEAEARAEKAGLIVVANRCIKIDHMQLTEPS